MAEIKNVLVQTRTDLKKMNKYKPRPSGRQPSKILVWHTSEIILPHLAYDATCIPWRRA